MQLKLSGLVHYSFATQ